VAVTATPSGSAIGIGIRRRDGIGAVVGIVIRIGLGSGSGSGIGTGSGIDRDHCSRSPIAFAIKTLAKPVFAITLHGHESPPAARRRWTRRGLRIGV
jgi:hypothetical protein